jgi:purine-binding chemotaxis protein CheW
MALLSQSKSSDAGQFVTLALGQEVFAVPVAFVREILDYRTPFKVPEGPPYLLGLIDVRGRGTPLIDLRLKLGLPSVPPDAATRILVLDVPVGDRILALALVADRVIEVATFKPEEVEAAPDIGVPWRSDYIQGVVRREQDFVVLFDLPTLLASAQSALAGSALAGAGVNPEVSTAQRVA